MHGLFFTCAWVLEVFTVNFFFTTTALMHYFEWCTILLVYAYLLANEPFPVIYIFRKQF